MAETGKGQALTAFAEARAKVARDAVLDNHPVLKAMDEAGGIRRIDGGRTVLDESLVGQNSTVQWTGESGTVAIADDKVVDSPEYDWSYLVGSISMTYAEQYKNEGQGRYIDIMASKMEALEGTAQNVMHAGVLSNGTGAGGLQIDGLAALISTTPTSGTVGTINRASAGSSWFRNQKHDTSADWSDGAVSSANVLKFLNRGILKTTKNSQIQATIALLGEQHYEDLSSAVGPYQTINDTDGTAKVGFQYIKYRGVKCYQLGGVNYSGQDAGTSTRSYLLCVKPGGVNLVYHKKAEFAILKPVHAQDQVAFSRMLFTMACMTVGANAKLCWVGFD